MPIVQIPVETAVTRHEMCPPQPIICNAIELRPARAVRPHCVQSVGVGDAAHCASPRSAQRCRFRVPQISSKMNAPDLDRHRLSFLIEPVGDGPCIRSYMGPVHARNRIRPRNSENPGCEFCMCSMDCEALLVGATSMQTLPNGK